MKAAIVYKGITRMVCVRIAFVAHAYLNMASASYLATYSLSVIIVSVVYGVFFLLSHFFLYIHPNGVY